MRKRFKTDEDLVTEIKKTIPLGDSMKITELAKKLRVSRSEIEDVVESAQGLDLMIAVKSRLGISNLRPSEYTVEHYE